jgi:hypothetical protein
MSEQSCSLEMFSGDMAPGDQGVIAFSWKRRHIADELFEMSEQSCALEVMAPDEGAKFDSKWQPIPAQMG